MDIVVNINIDSYILQKYICKQIDENIKNLKCGPGKHCFIPVNDGSLDVICVRCGVKAMRATIKIK